MDTLAILLLALAIDLALGEPPRWLHPVVGMGKVIAFLEKGAGTSPRGQFLYGVMMTLLTLAVFVVPTYFLLAYLIGVNFAIYVIIGTLLLKSTFSLRGLRQAALKVKRLLDDDRLDEARFELRALVGRNTANLPKPLLVSAVVESVAESTCDGLVAPLFYFALFGVPGAVAYRVANTLDSMVGYHGKFEYLGKFAARLDDFLNFIPARLSALLLALAAWLSRRKGSAWGTALADHARTASPNGGWPMAAMAGALGVQLEKVGYHKLGRPASPLAPETIAASLRLMQVAVLLWVALCAALGVVHAARA